MTDKKKPRLIKTGLIICYAEFYVIGLMRYAPELIKGYEEDNTVRPLNNATRAEIAALQRFIEANK